MALDFAKMDPRVREAMFAALAWAKYYGLNVTVTSGHRDTKKQTQLRKQYEACLARGEKVRKSNPNPACRYPANRPGTSAHEFGFAFDSWVPDAQMPTWIQLRRALGWKVPDDDVVHAEVPRWQDYTDLYNP